MKQMCRRYLAFIALSALFAMLVSEVSGQTLPVQSVPSPEVASLGMYGTVPVSLFTGVPDISIPLYEVKAGGYTLPVAVSYHTALVKPHSQPGCLGLGWSLMAGGSITRTVRGVYDEMKYRDKLDGKQIVKGQEPGFYAQCHRMKNITSGQFKEETKRIHQNMPGDEWHELCADEFSFNFCGYSGNFYRSAEGGWNVVSAHAIRVEFDENAGFVSIGDVGKRINLEGWERAVYNDRYFCNFTLVTPDGCRYEFGGLDAMDFCIPYYTRTSSDLVATGWHLTRIVTPEGHTIELEYDGSNINYDLRYVPSQVTVYNLPSGASNPNTGRNGLTGFLLFSSHLSHIRTSDEQIDFTYYENAGVNDWFAESVLGWENSGFNHVDIYSVKSSLTKTNFHQLLSDKPDLVKKETYFMDFIKANQREFVLHSMAVKNLNGGQSKTVYFEHSFENRLRLNKITERVGFHDPEPIYTQDGHGRLVMSGYKIPDLMLPGTVPEYTFEYNTTRQMPRTRVFPKTDDWGYYRGGEWSMADHVTFESHAPSLIDGLAEMLTGITWPTGGKTRFEYEQHDYAKVVNATLTSVSDERGKCGGLRIAVVSREDADGKLLSSSHYRYVSADDRNAPSSGILKRKPTKEIRYTSGEAILELKSEDGFYPSVTNLNSPDVGYSCVIEETKDGKERLQGKVIYRFANYDADVYGNTHYDEPACYSLLTGDSYINTYSSHSEERGKLLSEEYYNVAGELLRKLEYKYEKVNPESFVTAWQTEVCFCRDTERFTYALVGTLTNTYMYSYLKTSVKETGYTERGTFSTERTFAYDNTRKLLKRETLGKGDELLTTTYTYPWNYPEYGWMTEKNIVSPIVEKVVSNGASSRGERTDYTSSGSAYYPYRCTMLVNGLHRNVTFNVTSADIYGNPLALEDKGLKQVLIWGCEGQRLLMRIENATLKEVQGVLGKDVFSYSSQKLSAIDYSALMNIRHKLPFAHCYIYKYNKNLLLESSTSADGTTLFYDYDYAGRLRGTSLLEKGTNPVPRQSIVNGYDYYYHIH